MLQLLAAGQDATRGEVARAVAGRRVVAAIPPLLEAAESESGTVRQEALRALGALAGEPELAAMVALAMKTRSPEDQTAAVEAIGKVFARIGDKTRLRGTHPDSMGAGSRRRQTDLAAAVGQDRFAAGAAGPANRHEACECRGPRGGRRRAGAVAGRERRRRPARDRGQRRGPRPQTTGLARLHSPGHDRANPTGMLEEVLKHVERVNDKKLVLEGLGLASDSPAALAIAAGYLDDRQLQATAGLAALRIANRLQDRDPQLAQTTLKRVIETVENADVRQRAQEVLNDMDKYEGHILEWVVPAPSWKRARTGQRSTKPRFRRRQPGAEGVSWQPITKGIGTWVIDLEATFGGMDYCAAYLRTRVWSPVEQDAQLEMGSDDGVKAWWNGAVVFDQWGEGSVTPRQKRVKVSLASRLERPAVESRRSARRMDRACRLRARRHGARGDQGPGELRSRT